MELYRYTNVQEIKFNNFDLLKNIKIKDELVKNNYGFLILYSCDCEHCKDNVYIWSELSNNFKNFNFFAYNIYDFDNENEKLLQYLSVPNLPRIMNVTKKGTLNLYKDNCDYDYLFYYINKKLHK